MLVVLSRDKKAPPHRGIGQTGIAAPPMLGADAHRLAPGATAVLDQRSVLFPLAHLADLPVGEYSVQAIFAHNRDLNLPHAPGNLHSEPKTLTLDPAKGGPVRLELTQAFPADELPKDEQHVKFIRFRSGLLSKFHGRPMYLRAGLILPRDFETQAERRYPLRVHIGGYGTRYTAVRGLMQKDSEFRKNWLADDCPRMLLLHLDGAGTYGDPYQVNSSNNGPYGDAVTQELIPYVEKHYRGIGQAHARVLDGASTGGWVSLALQIFYPDFFGGAWAHCPDPVDFRSYELIDIYKDDSAYVNSHGFERPSAREPSGETRSTVRHECQMEGVLGRGDRWELSGKDWCAWNAVFSPRGADGLPRPLWDGRTGKLDRTVAEHWKQYDLRMVLEKNWPTLAPKLRGKLRIWVGDADNYFLNNAVHRLDTFLSGARPPYEGKIVFSLGKDHGWRGITEEELIRQMAAAIEARR
jgi:hypothetical protein